MSDQRQFTLRQIDQARSDFAALESDLQLVMGQLARVPTRGELARASLGIIFCTAVLTTLRLDCLALKTRRWERGQASSSRWRSRWHTQPRCLRQSTDPVPSREFQREHPCPSTGLTTDACPGSPQPSRTACDAQRASGTFGE